MKTIVLVPPVTEPVTLSEAKAQLRIEDAFTEDDDYIESLISVARDRCENYCNQFFTAQDIKILYSGNIPSTVLLPYGGLSVTGVTYTDQDGVLQTVSSSEYTVDSDNRTITFDNTYNGKNHQVLATTSAPDQIIGVKHAIKMILTDLYELRTESVIGSSVSENPALQMILYPYRENLGI